MRFRGFACCEASSAVSGVRCLSSSVGLALDVSVFAQCSGN